jgi:hypothetical protein
MTEPRGHADKLRDVIDNALDGLNEDESVVTGFLLVYPFCLAAQLEASPKAMNAILSSIHQSTGRLNYGVIRIISSTDDIPSRAHLKLEYSFLGTDMRQRGEILERPQAVATASDINLKFIAFGQEIRYELLKITSTR